MLLLFGGATSDLAIPIIDRILDWTGMYTDVINREILLKRAERAIFFNNKKVNIIQVGANDGKYNDPIYDIVKKNADITNIILVEPIYQIIPYLEKNYSYHPSASIVNKAVGQRNDKSLKLYGVKKEFWKKVKTGSNNNWPTYRDPTGIVSYDKRHVKRWIAENVEDRSDPSKILDSFEVEKIRPKKIANKIDKSSKIHILQVDAEGMDDEVVYSFFGDNIYPKVINIERNHLSHEDIEEYKKTLTNNGYSCYEYSERELLGVRD